MKIPFFRLNCDGNELKYIQDVLKSGWLTSGDKAIEFENMFAKSVNAKHAIAVNSCTAALHLGCEAAGVKCGSEVLVPSLTFTATAEVVEYLGGKVRLADINPSTGLLEPEQLIDALKRYPNITCVIPVHFAGRVAKMRGDAGSPGILDICEKESISVVEDAAHAFPAQYENGTSVGSSIGSFTTCFSFYANKTITTGEGGMLCTDDDGIASRVKKLRLHGIDRHTWEQNKSTKLKWEYDIVTHGYKYNLPDIAAAVGIAQLERSREFHKRRRQIAETYQQKLSDCPHLYLPSIVDKPESHAWHLFVIRLEEGIDRDLFIENLFEKGVSTSVHYKPLHRMTYWKKQTLVNAEDFPGAEAWWNSCVSLPLFPTMTDQEIEYVCTTVRHLLSES